MEKKELRDIVNGIFEMHDLTRTPRTGWQKIGVKDPESVAEHTLLTSQIAYILAVLEKAKNPEKIACVCLFHDNSETRIGDLNRINKKYSTKERFEAKAFMHFSKQFPTEAQKKLNAFFLDFDKRHGKEYFICKDADNLQFIFQAKYYLEIGYKAAEVFIHNTAKKLHTESAKAIYQEVLKTSFIDWLGEDYEYKK